MFTIDKHVTNSGREPEPSPDPFYPHVPSGKCIDAQLGDTGEVSGPKVSVWVVSVSYGCK